MKNYGYKVCYKKQGRHRTRTYLVTNDYKGAIWSVRWYAEDPPRARKTNKIIQNVEWCVLPITNYLEYKWLWRNCPF